MKLSSGILVSLSLVSMTAFATTSAGMLPDRIECNHSGSNYKLVLLLKAPQIPAGYTAFGLKDDAAVIFKTASQIFMDGNNHLKLVESPATANPKEVGLDLQTKVAKLNHFHRADLPDGSEFACQY